MTAGDRDIGAAIAPLNLDINAGYDGSSYTGAEAVRHPAGQDQQEYRSGVLVVATTGGSGGDTVVGKLQHRPDGGSWEDVTDFDGNAVEVTLNDASGEGRSDFDASQLDDNLRVRFASSDQTVGSTIDLVSQIVLGGARIEPVAGSN